MASTTTKILTKKFHFSTELRGRGGPDPFVVKDYENGPFFNTPLNTHKFTVLWQTKIGILVVFGHLHKQNNISTYDFLWLHMNIMGFKGYKIMTRIVLSLGDGSVKKITVL